MIAEYVETGQVYYVIKDFPLDSIHPQARKAGEAAECAGAQGAYWPMHDRLFAGQGEWGGHSDALETFVRYAGELGLDATAFRSCLEGGQFALDIQTDQQEGFQVQVSATPSFLINGHLAVGALPYANLRQIIEQALGR